jgi:hypothetical protein
MWYASALVVTDRKLVVALATNRFDRSVQRLLPQLAGRYDASARSR